VTCRVRVEAELAYVFAPYELRELIKTFPGRRWHPDLKCWSVPAYQVDALADVLRAGGQPVYFTAGGNGQRPSATPSTPTRTWAEHLFAAVGPSRTDAAYRAMSKVLHPDADNGDTVLMQQLNAGRRGLDGAR
jgi:hypothetical protein